MNNSYRITKSFSLAISHWAFIVFLAILLGACSEEIDETKTVNSAILSPAPSTDAHMVTRVATSKAHVPTQNVTLTNSVETPLPSSPEAPRIYNPAPPDEPVKLIFVHHSVGQSWLGDGHGRLALELANNNYFVSDVSGGWGPNNIGDHTDYGWWWEWFGSANHVQIIAALSAENGQTLEYTRLPDPGGENEIIMIKPCFTNHPVCGNADDPPTPGDDPPRNFGVCQGGCFEGCEHTVGNIKRVLLDILETFRQHPEKLFVIVTAPPPMERLSPNNENSRGLGNWIYYDWLDGYDGNNVVVFDLFNVWTTNGGDYDTNDLGLTTGNHHRLTSSPPYIIEHITDGDDDPNPNVMEYPSCCYNAHPNKAGARKATAEFVPLLNAYYNEWKID